MGLSIPDLEVYYTEYNSNQDCWAEVEEIIESHTTITFKNAQYNGYASVDGENLFCELYKYPEYINGISKGREPLYENEILVTELVAELLEVEIGDEVTVAFGKNSDTFIISGFYQSGNDSGAVFAMNFEGCEKLGGDTSWAYYKAIGFTTKKLRLNFGIRFLIIAVLGSAFGAIISVLFSGKLLGAVLSLIGLSRVVLEYSFMAIFVPTVAIALAFFLFAYLASGKIKRVETKELITE